MNKLHAKKLLSTAVSMAMTATLCQSVATQASDIDIYRQAFQPNPVVMFALDNSGSMSATPRRVYDLKDSMQAVLLGEGTIQPARNVLAGLSTFDNPAWYPIYSGSGANTTELYKTAVHPDTTQVEQKTSIKVPRSNAGLIASPVQMLDNTIVYPSGRKDMFTSSGDVIFKNGSAQPTATGDNVTIDDNNKKVYIRFQADVPKGATINAAYLELRSATDNGANNLKVKVAKHSNLYAANPSITNLQTFSGSAGSKTVATNVNNTYLSNIFNASTTQRAISTNRNYYKQDNVSNRNNMYVYSMDVKTEMEELIKNNSNWCGMGDIVIELSRDSNKNYNFYANKEDRVNPQLYIDWTLTNNSIRTNNCLFADTKRSSAQRITNLGNVNATGAMLSRQAMNLQIQRMFTNTRTPTSALLAETAAYMLGNSTYPLTNTSPPNTSIDDAIVPTTGIGTSRKYVSPIQRVANASADPTAYTQEQQCGKHGLYFLTDGEEDPTPTVNDKLFGSSLLGGGTFNCSGSQSCQTSIAGTLAKKTGYTPNNRSLKIKTSTVGFNTNSTSNAILANVANIGEGQYTSVVSGNGTAKADIVNSISVFLNEVFGTHIPEVTTGSPTLPQDALNPLRIQPYAYYASFSPKPDERTQLWMGNLNKYHVVNGGLYSKNATTKLIADNGTLNSAAAGIWTGGVKDKLSLGFDTDSGDNLTANRKIYSNRTIDSSGTAIEDNELHQVSVANLFGGSGTLKDDPQKNYWLNLLGYNVAVTDSITSVDDLASKAELRQIGSTMHSTPILLTQEGKITTTNGVLDTTDRKDYLLFGTTQGLLHVVKAGKDTMTSAGGYNYDGDGGKEIFTFAPNEMMKNQREAFLALGGASTGGASSLFYGIDAPWTAYTEYVSNKDGSLTVGTSDVNKNESTKGKQWVYGGLRMGGYSYYALDLTTIDKPKLKFHIDPENQKIYTAGSAATSVPALQYMGQSWSKPTIAQVKFNGTVKTVMIVGGGYDANYEVADYDPSIAKGNGVYMFDADTGALLWWASSSASVNGGATAKTQVSNMTYSVVSQINAIDRDNDGLVDNLYFGDLGGQAFRVDLDNTATTTSNFAKRVIRLTNQHVADGESPRFYEMPSFSVHHDVNLGFYGIVALSSGNRSSPLVGTAGTGTTNNQSGSTVSASDGVFVIFDKDVGKKDLYNSPNLVTQNVVLDNLKSAYQAGVSVSKAGWYYQYGSSAGLYKGMNAIYAVDSILYANVFYRDGVGTNSTNTCDGGVKGDSLLYRFCLPSGSCLKDFADSSQGKESSPQSVKLGVGILGSGLGTASGSNFKNISPSTLDCTQAANKSKLECQEFTAAGQIRTLRWYEKH